MRAVAKFRQSQRAVQVGAVQDIPQWQTTDERQRLIAIQLAEYEARKVEEAERITRSKNHYELSEITFQPLLTNPQFQDLTGKVFENHVAECDEALADFTPRTKKDRKLLGQLKEAKAFGKGINGHSVKVEGGRWSRK